MAVKNDKKFPTTVYEFTFPRTESIIDDEISEYPEVSRAIVKTWQPDCVEGGEITSVSAIYYPTNLEGWTLKPIYTWTGLNDYISQTMEWFRDELLRTGDATSFSNNMKTLTRLIQDATIGKKPR